MLSLERRGWAPSRSSTPAMWNWLYARELQTTSRPCVVNNGRKVATMPLSPVQVLGNGTNQILLQVKVDILLQATTPKFVIVNLPSVQALQAPHDGMKHVTRLTSYRRCGLS